MSTSIEESAWAKVLLPPRSPLYAIGGIGASAHPFVTDAGLEILRAGGNAMDAAIAAGAVMMCTEPRSGHLGGDGFVLFRQANGAVQALNGSGAAPSGASLEYFREHGGFPAHGLPIAAVPGIVNLWCEASKRFGTKPLSIVLARGIHHARTGIPVTERLQSMMAADIDNFLKYPTSAAMFFPKGKVPEVGEVVAQPALASALQRIAAGGADEFYRGAMAREMVAFSQANGGFFSLEDFATHTTEVAPALSATYRGCTVFEEPPVSPGVVTLFALNILERFNLRKYEPHSAQHYHLLIEVMKLAFADRRELGDPRFVENNLEHLLSDSHADEQAARIDLKRASPAGVPVTKFSDTDSIVFGDAEGNVAAYIHSLFSSCGVVMGDTGVLMNRRMCGFSLDAGTPNVVAPGKRPMHTLNNFLVNDPAGEFMFGGGTPGGNFQVQMNLQIITDILDFDMSVSEASDSPRFTVGTPHAIGTVRIESRVPSRLFEELRALGHDVEPMGPWEPLSAMQVIARDPHTKVYRGATDIRRPDCTVGGI